MWVRKQALVSGSQTPIWLGLMTGGKHWVICEQLGKQIFNDNYMDLFTFGVGYTTIDNFSSLQIFIPACKNSALANFWYQDSRA